MEDVSFSIHKETNKSIVELLCDAREICQNDDFWNLETKKDFPQIWINEIKKYVTGKNLYAHLKALQDPYRGDFHEIIYNSKIWKKLYSPSDPIIFLENINTLSSLEDTKTFSIIREYYVKGLISTDIKFEIHKDVIGGSVLIIDIPKLKEKINNTIMLFIEGTIEKFPLIEKPISNIMLDRNIDVYVTIRDNKRDITSSTMLEEDEIFLSFFNEMKDDLERLQNKAKKSDNIFHLLYRAKVSRKISDHLLQPQSWI